MVNYSNNLLQHTKKHLVLALYFTVQQFPQLDQSTDHLKYKVWAMGLCRIVFQAYALTFHTFEKFSSL